MSSSPKRTQAATGIQALLSNSRVSKEKFPRPQAEDLSLKTAKTKQTNLKSKQFLYHNRRSTDSVGNEHDDETTTTTTRGGDSAEITVIRKTIHFNKNNSNSDSNTNKKLLNENSNKNNKGLKSNKISNNNNKSSSISNEKSIDTSLLKIKSLEILNEELIEQNKSLKQQLLVSQANCSIMLAELTRSKRKLNQILKKL